MRDAIKELQRLGIYFVQVAVTQSDIDQGAVKMRSACPLALALRPYLRRPRVSHTCVTVVTPRHNAPWIYDETPLGWVARKFVADFDAGRPVKPFTLRLVTR